MSYFLGILEFLLIVFVLLLILFVMLLLLTALWTLAKEVVIFVSILSVMIYAIKVLGG